MIRNMHNKLVCCISSGSQELESENQFMQAENHFVLANDWKAAANMYNAHDLWDDAYRVISLAMCTFVFALLRLLMCVYR